MAQYPEQIRLLTQHDLPAIERLLRTSEYMYQRFTVEELPLMSKHNPGVGLFHDTSLNGFLLSQTLNAPSAWIGGFGVSWTESRSYQTILATLLNNLSAELVRRNVRHLYYSGNDLEHDWLRPTLLAQTFTPYRKLYAYDKYDYGIPSEGNQQVQIRPVLLPPWHPDSRSDLPALLEVENACFEGLWRYNALTFYDIVATHPYFVVATLNQKVVGYQFNALDDDAGYLVRIAVHPSVEHQGIGVRLMAEAIRFFQHARVSRIMLNTEENNTHAHQLYEWFGFIRLQQMGFVLRKNL